MIGGLDEHPEAPGTERFRELADPARTLSPEDLHGNGRERASASRETREPR
jgi:hypothetical protein